MKSTSENSKMNARLHITIILAIAPLLAGCADERSARKFEPAIDKIYVIGDFVKPGSFVWTNGVTLTDAISLAGGFEFHDTNGLVYIYHQDGNKDKVRIETLTTNQIELKPGDRVLERSLW